MSTLNTKQGDADRLALESQVSEMRETITKLETLVADQTSKLSSIPTFISHLDGAMRAALESKFNALPIEVRAAVSSAYPNVTTAVERYALRQMVREANGKLASQKRPGWDATILQWAPALKSLDETTKATAEKNLRVLSEQFDLKEATARVKKYKIGQDTTSNDPHIKHICNVFGIDPANLK